ncbi:MAG: hypothetical protein H0V84_07185 [Actinobacteria bacterium]|nr:hypothetical protein [Actinomycetota bacterium]
MTSRRRAVFPLPPRAVAHHAILAEILGELRAIRRSLDRGRAGPMRSETARPPPTGARSREGSTI